MTGMIVQLITTSLVLAIVFFLPFSHFAPDSLFLALQPFLARQAFSCPTAFFLPEAFFLAPRKLFSYLAAFLSPETLSLGRQPDNRLLPVFLLADGHAWQLFFIFPPPFLSRTPIFPTPPPTDLKDFFQPGKHNSLPDSNLLTGDINIVTWPTFFLIGSYLTAISVLSTRSAICRSQKPSCFASSSLSLLRKNCFYYRTT